MVIELLGREWSSTALVGASSFLLSLYVIRRVYNRKYNYPPGPYPLPILGNLLAFRNADPMELFQSFRKTHGDACTIYIGRQPFILLNSIDLIREAFVKKGSSVSERSQSYTVELFTEGYKDVAFGMYSDPVWKLQRKIIHNALRKYGNREKAEELAHESVLLVSDYLKERTGPFDPEKIISMMIYNIICTMSLGRKTTSLDDPFFVKVSNLADALNEASGSGLPPDYIPVLQYLPLPILKTFKTNILELLDIFGKAVQEHKASFDPDDISDFTHELIQMESEAAENPEDAGIMAQFTPAHFRQLLTDIFFAGTDTTRTTLHWLVQYVAMYPETQKKMQAEIDSVIGLHDRLHLSDKVKLQYTEAVICEVMRLRPVAGLAIPHVTKEDVTIGDYHLPKGTDVAANLYSLFMDERYYSEPEKFLPERFIGEDGKVHRPDSFIPFSVGKRQCPGEILAKHELLIVTSYLFRRFSFVQADGHPLTAKCKNVALVCIPEPYQVSVVSRE